MGTTTRPAVGLVHRPAGTPTADRDWARGLVVRLALERRLTLVDILELNDDADRTRDVLRRLAALATSSGARILVTEGVAEPLASALARDLALVHEAVTRREPTPPV